MSFKRCPGSLAFSQPRIEMVECPSCGGDVEVWSDEPTGRCISCDRTVTRTSTQSCLDWCKYARECLGDEKYKQYQSLKSTVRKEALVAAASDRFGWGKRRLNSAWLVIERTEQLLRARPEADPNVILAAVVICFGCSGSPSEMHAEAARSVARDVLGELDYPHGFVEKVCALVVPSDPVAASDPDVATVRAALGDED